MIFRSTKTVPLFVKFARLFFVILRLAIQENPASPAANQNAPFAKTDACHNTVYNQCMT